MPSIPGNKRKLLLAGVLAGAVLALVVLYPVQVGNRLHADFIPIDASPIGSNIMAGLIAGGLAYLILRPIWSILTEDYRTRLDRNARLMQHIIEHSDVPNENRYGHSMLTDEFLQDPPPVGGPTPPHVEEE